MVLTFTATAFLLAGTTQLRAQFGPPQKHEPKGPWENKSLSPEERADLVLAQITLDEKIQLLHGLGWGSLFQPPTSGPGVRSLGGAGFIPGIERLGLPDIQMSDAAVGVARGSSKSRYSTALPSAVNPSGKLPITFANNEADLPHPAAVKQPPAKASDKRSTGGIPGFKMNETTFDVPYDEGLKVGYKWYDAENKNPLFPFGFGLSYTTFAYSELKAAPGNSLDMSFRVKNTGKVAGEEIAQVYLTLPASTQEPPKRLVGWSKVRLAPVKKRPYPFKWNRSFFPSST